ncbi:putative uncharacterized protein [Bacteroides sp. CAG:714]|nr:putative uncharacterized protein [Bacteroides sp. CAG:714]
MFGGLKNSRNFASLSKGSTSENRGFGEVAEWSIAAVLKTVVLRGTRGSNPCLSAFERYIRILNIVQDLERWQSGRLRRS